MQELSADVVLLSYGGSISDERIYPHLAGGSIPGNMRVHPGCRDKTPFKNEKPLAYLLEGGFLMSARRSPAWKISQVEDWLQNAIDRSKGLPFDETIRAEIEMFNEWLREGVPTTVGGPGMPILDTDPRRTISCNLIQPGDLETMVDPRQGKTIVRGRILTAEQLVDITAQENLNPETSEPYLPGDIPTVILNIAKELTMIDCYGRTGKNAIQFEGRNGPESIELSLGKAYGRIVYAGKVEAEGRWLDAFTFTSPFSIQTARANLPARFTESLQAIVHPGAPTDRAALYEGRDSLQVLNPMAPGLEAVLRTGLKEIGAEPDVIDNYVSKIPGNFRTLDVPTPTNQLFGLGN